MTREYKMPYLLPIQDTLSQAWSRVHGSKKSFWASIGIASLILAILVVCGSIFANVIPALEDQNSWLYTITQGIFAVIFFLFEMGFIYIGVERALDKPITYQLMWQVFEWRTALRLIGYSIVQFVIWMSYSFVVGLGFLISLLSMMIHMPLILRIAFIAIVIGILVFILIYISVRIYLTRAFILDKKLDLFTSLRASYTITYANFWRIIFIGFISVLILLLSLIPLGIGLIWSIPFIFILYGTVYRNLLTNNYTIPSAQT
jgi:hypothetical protein